MSTADDSLRRLWGESIAAYVGRGVRKIPTADESALFAVAPDRFEELLALVKDALRVSDSIEMPAVPRQQMKAAVTMRMQELLPELDEQGIDALVWRWGFLQFHG